MPVRWITDGLQAANSFVYGNILVDAGVLPMKLTEFRDQIDTIILTHCHYDHTAHVVEIARMCDATVCIHTLDAPGLTEDARNLAMLFGARAPAVVPDRILQEGDRVGSLTVLHTPGHTPGCICLYDCDEQTLFSGDTVFTGGSFGRYDFPGGDRTALAASLARLADLEIEGLYPGHGEPVAVGGHKHIAAARELMRTYG
ncbi:MBL fold metallo-hydrolase [Methanoculleus sp. FWC-SCC1]|uniref:MBL fold metallo-hydrolase n=1 Tax=Methanoculleus frigidifontis TaxID=2584085 RepID=A0ABT8MA57_9EURY|nr:MBL fold metallo-hydrolase [Methanoculleus sp. FWC-SCC1]MDN7024812.1 MBL fold metallo-hydrolase [Methanoculleus sp. FWC-SCC1]